MGKSLAAWQANRRRARSIWGQLPKTALDTLRQLTQRLAISVAAGELQLLDGRWYITHTGLLRIAHRRRCQGIRTSIQEKLSNPLNNRWVCRAIVYRDPSSKGFVGYGDADPTNVTPSVRGSELRIAETRAVNRALRKAYGIGICSVEELGWLPNQEKCRGTVDDQKKSEKHTNGSNNGQPRLRDKLCLLIRQYNLNPTLVKAYAADFCGTETLGGASRDQVESFISHLTAAAKENTDGLICRLNSYGQTQEAKQ
jgi:hypothetical protein